MWPVEGVLMGLLAHMDCPFGDHRLRDQVALLRAACLLPGVARRMVSPAVPETLADRLLLTPPGWPWDPKGGWV